MPRYSPKPLVKVSTNVLATCKMFERWLIGDPASCYEISDINGVHHSTVARYVRHLHQLKVIRIAEWYLPGLGTRWTARYEINTSGEPDAPRPARQTSTERWLKSKNGRASRLRIASKPKGETV